MTIILLSITLSLLANEMCDVSPWLARRLSRWSAHLRYRNNPERLAIRLEEIEAVIADVPGKLSKLVCATGFVGGALAYRARGGSRVRFARPSAHVPLAKSSGHAQRQLTILWAVPGLVVLAACGLVLLTVSTARVGLGAELIGVAGALLPVGPVVAAFLWVDRWSPEPARRLWLAFGWGACVATIVALLINNTAEVVGDLLLGKGNGDKVSAIFAAPLFEEAAKGAFVLYVFVRLRNEFSGVIDGIVYTGLAAAGFAFVENIYYFGRSFAEHGFGDTAVPGLVTAFILRGVLAPFTHPLFTCMIGIGAGIAARTPHPQLRVLAPVGGYLAAVVLHALWNGSATLDGGKAFLSVYFLVMVPIFLTGVYFVHWHRRREQKIVSDALPAMVGEGFVAGTETDRLTSLLARRDWRQQARRRSGPAAARAVAGYQAAVAELAFLRHAITLGAAAPDAPGHEAKLVALLTTCRTRAVRDAGLPPITINE